MARFHLQALGELSLREGGPEGEVLVGGSKGLAVLAYLAATPDHGAARDYLADLLWPSRDHSASRQCLRQALYYVRQKAGGRLTVTEDGVLRLLDERLSADLWAVEAALDAERWEDAVALDRGPFLGEFRADSREFRHWADSRRDGLEAGLRLAYRRLVDARLARDEAEAAAEVARRWRDRDPLDEEAVKALIRALTAAGDGAAAHRAFEAYRGLLRRELDDEPGEELARRAAGLRSLLEEGPPEGAGSLEAAEDRAPVWIASPWRASGPGANRVSPGDGGLSVDPVAERPPPLPSPDGRWIARGEAREDGWDLVVTDASGGEARRALIRAPGDEHPLAWSPDGDRLAFVSRRDGNADVYVARLADGSVRRVTRTPDAEEHVRWLDAGRLAVVRWTGGHESEIWSVPLDGEGEARLLGRLPRPHQLRPAGPRPTPRCSGCEPTAGSRRPLPDGRCCGRRRPGGAPTRWRSPWSPRRSGSRRCCSRRTGPAGSIPAAGWPTGAPAPAWCGRRGIAFRRRSGATVTTTTRAAW